MENIMEFFFGLIMFICIVPTVLILFVRVYPKSWREKKLVLGVKNRDEFREGAKAGEVDAIVRKRRTQALVIVIATCIISALLLLMRGMLLETTVWTAFIFIALILLELPYVFGNRELKAVKRELGLGGEAGVSYVDLSNAGAVHALQPVRVWLPTLLGLVPVIIALLTDLGIILKGKVVPSGSFLMTGALGIFWLTSVMLLIFSYVFDNLKNEVISRNSDVNANYNRAKKKNFVDWFVLFLWINLVLMICMLASFIFLASETVLMIGAAVYLLLVMFGVVMFAVRSKRIDARYEKEMDLLGDDDDLWILGMFYYNPNDSRLNVEKRAGVGATINMGHPAGKVITGFLGIVLAGVVVMLVWLGMTESTPMTIKAENGTVICHQLSDEYVISSADIKSAEYGDDWNDISLIKTFGTRTANILKGTFTADGEQGCKVFIWAPNGNYIKIVTADTTYYINGSTAEETKEVYEAISGDIAGNKKSN